VNGLLEVEAAKQVLRLKVQQTEASSVAIEISTTLFQAGKATYFEVLLAQQNRLSAELDRVHAAKTLRSARVDIYSALGGGALPVNTATSSEAP
jgi:outer membrane protein TolC